MRDAALLLCLVALLGPLCGCRTPVTPLTVPVANLYPTLNPSAVLDECRPVNLTSAELTAVLAHLGLLGPLKTYGMGPGELPVVRRGLERHGYAELDARRTVCPVRWVVLRSQGSNGASGFLVEAGLEAPPATAAQWAIDVKRPPATISTRNESYGGWSKVEVWRGTADSGEVEVRRVTPRGALVYWELSYRTAVRAAVPADS